MWVVGDIDLVLGIAWPWIPGFGSGYTNLILPCFHRINVVKSVYSIKEHPTPINDRENMGDFLITVTRLRSETEDSAWKMVCLAKHKV
jgi:hypothetical protein